MLASSTVFECVNMNFCGLEPYGNSHDNWEKGWKATTYGTSALAVSPSEAAPVKHYLDVSSHTWNVDFPYQHSDVVMAIDSSEITPLALLFHCVDVHECRNENPYSEG